MKLIYYYTVQRRKCMPKTIEILFNEAIKVEEKRQSHIEVNCLCLQ